MALFARTDTDVAHCPGSNTRLGSGTAPIRAMRKACGPVGLAVDGSASNVSGHLLAEARLPLLLQRVGSGVGAMSARENLEMASLGGAGLLGRDDIGALAPAWPATSPLWHWTKWPWPGPNTTPSPPCCSARCQVPGARRQAPDAKPSVVQGRVLVHDGELATLDRQVLVREHLKLARQLLMRSWG